MYLPNTSNNIINGNDLSFTSSTYNNMHPFSSSSQYYSPHHISIEDGTFFNELLGQDNSLSSYAHNNVVVHDNVGKCGNINNGAGAGAGFNQPETSTTTNKRSVSKKDRHSKIMTARGPRDRRMRLSLDVAKKFFKLQDVLGFDKASETVNWLLMNSKSDIQQLLISHHRPSFSGVSNSASSTSNCELLLVTNNSINNDDEQKAKSSSCSSNLIKEKKRANKTRKSSYLFRPLAKETREMARKRARDRTLEKTTTSKCLGLATNNQDVVNRYSYINQLPENIISSHFQLIQQGYIGDNSSSSMADNWNDPSNCFLINNQPDGGVLEHQVNYIQRLGSLWGDNN